MGANHTYRYVNTNNIGDIEPANLASTLEASSWQAIAYHASIGDLSNYFSVGDTKTITIGAINMNIRNGDNFDGGHNMTMKIAGFNHNGSTNTVDFISAYGHGYCAMHSSNSLTWGYADTQMRAMLNGRFFNALNADLRQYIIEKPVKAYSEGTWSYTYNYKNALYDKIWLLTNKEVGLTYYSVPSENSANETYPIFTNSASRQYRDYNASGSLVYWWTASQQYNQSNMFCCVGMDGNDLRSDKALDTTSDKYYVVFGFRLGKKS